MYSTTCTIDTTGLNRAQALFSKYGNTVPALAVNRTALFVVRAAQKMTPVVSPSRINMDLNVVTSPAVLLSGKLSTAKNKQNSTVTFKNRKPDEDDVSTMNTAQRIVLARLHPNSQYSKDTGNRWGIKMPDFGRGRGRGRGRYGGGDTSAQFWKFVKDVAERMTKARRSSKGFFQHSWTAIIEQLLPNVPPIYRNGFERPENDPHGSTLMSGEVSPARPGGNYVQCAIANTIGLKNGNSVLGEKYNRDAQIVLLPMLQLAIDREYKSKMEYAARQGWMENAAELKALGFNVT